MSMDGIAVWIGIRIENGTATTEHAETTTDLHVGGVDTDPRDGDIFDVRPCGTSTACHPSGRNFATGADQNLWNGLAVTAPTLK